MKTKIFVFIVINVLHLILCDSEPSGGKSHITISRTGCPPNESSEQPINRVNTTSKLSELRALLLSAEENIQAFLVTTGDEHQSEFVSDYDKRLKYISGFSGSNGNAIITLENAVFWSDGRYRTQANDELDCNWILLKEWKINSFKKFLPSGTNVGADPKLISAQTWEYLELELKRANKNFTLVPITNNLIDVMWTDRDKAPVRKGFSMDTTYTGKTWMEKINETREALEDSQADAMVATALDDVAWLLNIRGEDIPYSCLLKSYLILTQNETILYVDPNKIEGNITESFKIANASNYSLSFKNYTDIWTDLPIYSQNQTVLVPFPYGYSHGASKAIYDLVPKRNRMSEPSPIIHLRAKKNDVEILNMENAHIRDSAALCRFFQYLESHFNIEEEWDELRLSSIINTFRSQQDNFINISFETIVAFGPHGALPHYVPTLITSSRIFDNSTIVIDSGGQYYDGTTDVTRTIHLGIPTKEQIEAYTRVLMGSIDLSSLVFPSILPTYSIDVLARAPLWKIGYDYPHGTSHGIGAALNVHESPVNFFYGSTKMYFLKPGYFISNEPGYYLDDDFGIRLENAMEVIEKIKKKTYRGNSYLGFKDVTLVPYDNKLIDFNLLGSNHVRWLNDYNTRIRNLVGPELKRQNASEAFNWMMEQTKYIPHV